MNKKGFTLIELIAAITILGILIVLIAPNVIEMRNNVLKKSLQSKIDMIETAAINYATEKDDTFKILKTDCNNITVSNLIDQGYLIGDNSDKTQIINPITGNMMNGQIVCVKFDSDDVMTRKVVACVVGYSCQE